MRDAVAGEVIEELHLPVDLILDGIFPVTDVDWAAVKITLEQVLAYDEAVNMMGKEGWETNLASSNQLLDGRSVSDGSSSSSDGRCGGEVVDGEIGV